MGRKYTKVAQLAEIVRERHNEGETYAEIAASIGLEKKQLKKLMERQRRKERLVAAGYILRPKGRPCKEAASEEIKQHNGCPSMFGRSGFPRTPTTAIVRIWRVIFCRTLATGL